MSDHDHADFDANKIFAALFALTAIEVAWGMWMPGPNWWVWGGLIAMALGKGLLILQYFMHFKFEGWIVKCLIAPTPIMIMIVIFAITPDVAKNSRMDYRITDMVDPVTGEILTIGAHEAEEQGGGGEEH